ncbi:MAG: hypothetical protein J0M24_21405 [Verrucomicrobia bacterium]|nr:hypothetical protein [Verrucomicrobiota bacterium]
MEAREIGVIAYLDDTSAARVSSVVSEQFDELFRGKKPVEWQLETGFLSTGKAERGTEMIALRHAVAEAVFSQSKDRFVRYRVRISVERVQEEWTFAVVDELVPHIHLKLDRLNSAVTKDGERLIARACRGVVQRGFANFCWDANAFSGDQVSLYAYFKLQAARKGQPTLAVRPPGWEHSRFVENLRRTLTDIDNEVTGSVSDITWNELITNLQAIDALFSSEANKNALECLLRPLGFCSEEWLKAA